jgi:hypothetical protein
VMRAMSVVAIIGRCSTPGTWASGTVADAGSVGCHCLAPAGLSVSSHSQRNRVS